VLLHRALRLLPPLAVQLPRPLLQQAQVLLARLPLLPEQQLVLLRVPAGPEQQQAQGRWGQGSAHPPLQDPCQPRRRLPVGAGQQQQHQQQPLLPLLHRAAPPCRWPGAAA
jgi:hypothetical protein